MKNSMRDKVERLLSPAGIEIGGNQPWDIQVGDDGVYRDWLARGALALGETYMDERWDCPQLDEFFTRILRHRVDARVFTWRDRFDLLVNKLFNMQCKSRADIVAHCHYNIDNTLYRRMLDKRMIYSCGYFKDATTLDAAQEAKLELICRKLDLRPGMRVLDIGCGWGGSARFIAERYSVEITGITVAQEQAALAREVCAGLPVDIRLQDYRDIDGAFDRIFSIGMFEHVGYKNYDDYFRIIRRHLKPDGLFLLHTIGGNLPAFKTNAWINRYIFPNSMLPSARQILTASEPLFVTEDWHNFGAYYDTTLMHWYRNFCRHWGELKQRHDRRFYRMWEFFLLMSAGAFRARHNQLWQIVFSPHGVDGVYPSPR